jgi:hypothetical protein
LVILSQREKLLKFLKPTEYVKKIASWRDSKDFKGSLDTRFLTSGFFHESVPPGDKTLATKKACPHLKVNIKLKIFV